MLGQMELLLILGIVILLFGPKKFPDLMKGLGLGMKEFKKGRMDDEDKGRKPDASSGKKEESKGNNA